VTDDGVEVALTAKEFLLLDYFLRHQGRVLSRERLLTDVWGYHYAGGTRTVDVHVRRLRKKLPQLGGALTTVHQFGYKLLDGPAEHLSPARDTSV
jgi:DNA-binding response OmpR family regulator